MRVDVAVLLAAVVGVGVDVVKAPSPPDEQPYGQQHNETPMATSATLPTASGRYWFKRTSGRPTRTSAVPWPETPEKAHETGFAYLFPFLLGGDQGRHGCEVVGVARVPQTEQQADRAG